MIIKQIYQLCTCIILFSILLCSSFVSLYFPHFFKFKGSAIHIRTPPCFMDPPMVVAQTFPLHISSSRKNRPEVDFPPPKNEPVIEFLLRKPISPIRKIVYIQNFCFDDCTLLQLGIRVQIYYKVMAIEQTRNFEIQKIVKIDKSFSRDKV